MGIESNSQNRWRTARERARLKARYEIHSRVASVVHRGDSGLAPRACSSHDETSELQLLNATLRYLQSIVKNDLSAFSVASLARDGHCVNGPLPKTGDLGGSVDLSHGLPVDGYDCLEQAEAAYRCFLSTCDIDASRGQIQPATLATSKFGGDFVSLRLLPYLDRCQSYGGQITLLEYASLLGRHGIVGQMLLGGVDPTVTCSFQGAAASEDGTLLVRERDMMSLQDSADAVSASRRVLGLLHSLNDAETEEKMPVIPLSLWSYIVRAVVEMRMNGALDNKTDATIMFCQQCNKQTSTLIFGPPCHHNLCEPCLWMHLVRHVPNCIHLNQNVVTCPLCHVEFDGFQYCASARDKRLVDNHVHQDEVQSFEIVHESKHDDTENATHIYQQRCSESLAKFNQLPSTSAELKSLTKKNNLTTTSIRRRNKKLRDPISSTWHQALHPLISNHLSQDVRTDRFFKAVQSSPQVVMCYLQSGIDVNMRNEYGQTPLYVACWRGSAIIVRCLLEYGADANIPENSGGTCWSVARRWGRLDVLDMLERYANDDSCCASDSGPLENDLSHLESQQTSSRRQQHQPNVTILIDPTREHPGAGACIVDNALSDEELERFDQLSTSLPVVACDGTDDVAILTNDKAQHRPTRSYYCDAEHWVQDMLQNCIDAARQELETRQNKDTIQCSAQLDSFDYNPKPPPKSVFEHLRFLHYEQKGGLLPPHVDLCRIDDTSGHRSTHTFILYLTDCDSGGGTALLQHLNDPKVLAVAQPKRGRALIFPHLCPHSGLEVDCVPKILLRGEVVL